MAPKEDRTGNLPAHLKRFVVKQNYERYTPREQATWRYIMRRSRDLFQDKAHPSYLSGLEQTGIPLDTIPNIQTMDRILSKLGWGAVCVRGFIPPLAFLEFQSQRVLPIAADIRTLEQILYTPAPDIIHEAAGHAPILADPDYGSFLEAYATVAKKAISSHEDLSVYEAIRHLSDTKEDPSSTREELAEAEIALEKILEQVSYVSEAAKVARLYWWTAEYGLVGSMKAPKIYGAGLLSSLQEGKDCLNPTIKKIPLSVDCIEQDYDITRPQPQLYVARDFKHLKEVLKDLENCLAFKKGGVKALQEAIQAKTLTMTEFSSKFKVAGTVLKYKISSPETAEPCSILWDKGISLYQDKKHLDSIKGDYHLPLGFKEAIQTLPNQKTKTLKNLNQLPQDLPKGTSLELRFHSSFRILANFAGWLTDFPTHGIKLREAVLSWEENGEKLEEYYSYYPFIMASKNLSIYAPEASILTEENLGKASSKPPRQKDKTTINQQLYQRLREAREAIALKDFLKVQKEIESFILLTQEKNEIEWLHVLEAKEVLHTLITTRNNEPKTLKNWVEKETKTLLEMGGVSAQLFQAGQKLLPTKP